MSTPPGSPPPPGPNNDPPGTGTPDPRGQFLSLLPEDLRTHTSLASINNVGDLAKSYVHAQQLVGVQPNLVVRKPKDDSPEERARFFRELGVPEQPDGYQFDVPSKLPEGLEYKPEELNPLRDAFHKAGLSPEQAKGLHDWYMQVKSSEFEANKQAWDRYRQESEQALRTEFGAAYDESIDAAQQAMLEFGGKELVDYFEETGLGNDPRLVKAFAKIGRGMKDDAVRSGTGVSRFKLSPAEAQATIAQKQSDPGFMKQYMNRDDPGHANAMREMQELFQQAYPEQAGAG